MVPTLIWLSMICVWMHVRLTRQLVKASLCLRTNGFMISVFKLPHAALGINPLTNLKAAMNILSKRFSLVQARQLFHNRQEVTVVAAHPLQTKR